MLETLSTETLLNSFPMFGHPGISALEYAGILAESREKNRRASICSTSLKRKSTAETHHENTKTTTSAATGKCETKQLSLAPVHYIDEFGAQRKRKDMWVNHTPRNFDMRSPPTVDVYRPSTSSSNENYSRLRINSQNSRSSSAGPYLEQKRLTVNAGNPVELDSIEVGVASSPTMFASSPPISPEVYRPMAAPPHRRSISSPMTKIITYQPRQARAIISNQKREVRVRSTSTPDHDLKEKKQSRRQTPYKVTGPAANTSAPYASLEPWVAKHERNASTSDSNSDMPTQEDLEKLEEVAPLGVIQKYFDSQADSRDSSLRRVRHRHTPSPPKMPLPNSPDPNLRSTEPVAIFPIEDLELATDVPPAVPERSPKRLTNPRLPFRKESITSVDSDFARAAEGQFTEYDQRDSEIHVTKQRSQRVRVGQPARAGSSYLGRMAPPILSHGALTANSDLGLNDISFFLKHTGPAPASDSKNPSRQRMRGGPKIFKVKRKSLAARVGSVEGSPQRARQKTQVPTCTREVTTKAGAKHLKIVIPRLSGTDNLTLPMGVPGQQHQKYRSRHISLSFTEDMLVPRLASPAVERAIQGFSSYDRSSRSFSAPNIMDMASHTVRKEKSPPINPKPVPVLEHQHPLAEHPVSREEQTKARKLRDLNKIRRKEVPSSFAGDTEATLQRNSDTGPGALPTPRHTPEPDVGGSCEEHHSNTEHTIPIPDPVPSTVNSTIGGNEHHEMVGDSAVEIEVLEESSTEKMMRLQDRVMLLQRQNSALTAALAKVVGLEMEDGDLEPEFVLRTFRRCRGSRTPSGW
ncbi:hypothetical protein N0V91_002025 [Didymella pomorum]|uniref:Uncharacterized protein n=1 Tax=Didymella pomorum TaxID=749634 RepID=A0A9W8ZNH3_9PLEO|nr:hypothetical protein N0V91_002025 [Didymella pomorum]